MNNLSKANKSKRLELRLVSSLVKVFADEELRDEKTETGSMLLNETYSFQIAYRWDRLNRRDNGNSEASYDGGIKKHVQINIQSDLSEYISAYRVALIPSEMPCYADHDDNILRTAPGLYPDALYPLDPEGIVLLPEQWRAVWIEIKPENQIISGTYPIAISFIDETGEILGEIIFKLDIINALLPKQTLIHTQWFHTDCLSTLYSVKVFSEEHWKRVDQYIKTAVAHGINMILTPVFTPPLDTQVGGERPTVQLVDVDLRRDETGDIYKFGFTNLKRWTELCITNGVKYLEISHLFTQWGANHAPKIIGIVEGNKEQIFGWETDAAGEEYRNFLSQFLPELVKFIEDEQLQKKCFFHVSDEPSLEHLEGYMNASTIINKYLKDYPVIDALSNYEFYEKGLVKNPVPATNHIDKFLENSVPNLWAYYCCSQYRQVSNCFFNMPSARNRILGIQLYKFNIAGFLHWGYNFWYSQYSVSAIDPFRVTDANHAFPSGDAFLVYPGADGPIVSLRLKVLYEALQDMRALKLLEDLAGRDEVMGVLEEGLDEKITFDKYPSDAKWLLKKREQINRRIERFSFIKVKDA